LVSNAIKFTQEGHLSIKTSLINENNKAAEIRFSISDTGVGIPEDKLKTIFNSFEQAYVSTNSKFGGTGLGLAICKRLVELQGGAIYAESTIGEGTCFYFDLTFKKQAQNELDQKEQIEDLKTDRNLKGYSVLLVEDNQMNVFIAKQFLEGWDLSVGVTHDGIEAINELFSNQYNLVLMDLQMPNMDGYEASRTIRKYDQFKDLPIVALTASVLVELENKVLDAGMDDYLVKPFEPDDLHQIISKHLT